MTNRDDRIQELFATALEQPSPSRRPWLEAACGSDATLLAHVWQLLEAHARAGSFLADPGAEVRQAAAAAGGEQPGQQIGAYKLLQNIGEGGFGTVWMAEQREPVRRIVALKLLKPGMDSGLVVARFEQERQALALMQHPNIAQVFDAGTTEKGRPFFVMELVKGVPITDYCAREKLPVRARLELFVQVCRAVQHAHGKGLIHRDIKPRNVLVATADGKPLAKVIDFGIAKSTGPRLTDRTLFTEHRAMVGTLEYMSPEQAEGLLDVDTRSDVYSLGALLYEVLTGSTPFDSRQLIASGYAEILRVLREVDPARPSVRVSGRAGAGWASSSAMPVRDGNLFGVLKGDLDWVVMKALEKDRARRYASADGLAEDVERYLSGEAVRAVPPRVGYRVRKFVRRNLGLVIGGAAVAVTLLLGVVGITLQKLEAERTAEKLRGLARYAAETLNKAFAHGYKMTLQVTGDEHGKPLPETGVEQDKAVVEVALESLHERIEEQIQRAELDAYRANLNASVAYSQVESPALARMALTRCAEEHRGWEWKLVETSNEEGIRVLMARVNEHVLGASGTLLACLDDDGNLEIYDTRTWMRTLQKPIGIDNAKDLWLPTSDRLLVTSRTQACVLELPSCTVLRHFDLPEGDQQTVSRDGRRLARYSPADETLRVWDTQSGGVLMEVPSTPFSGSLTISHDGRFVAAYGDAQSRIWRIQDGTVAFDVAGYLDLNPFGPVSCSDRWEVVDLTALTKVAVEGAPRGDHGAYLDAEDVLFRDHETVAVRRVRDGSRISAPSRPRSDWPCFLTPDRSRLYARDMGWYGLSFLTGDQLAAAPIDALDISSLTADGKWWIAGDARHRLVVTSARPPRQALATGQRVCALGAASTTDGPRTISHSRTHLHVFEENTAAFTKVPTPEPDLTAVVGSPDGRRFLVRTGPELVVVDAESSQRQATLAGVPADVCALALSHDGALAAACDATDVRVWDTTTGSLRDRVAIDAPLVGGAAVLAVHAGRVAVATGNRVRLLSADTADKVTEHSLTDGVVMALLFEPDGSRLLVGTTSGLAVVLTVPDLAGSVELRGHLGTIPALAWSPSGDRVFTAGSDGTVRVWHARSRSGTVELMSLSEPSILGKPTCLLFPPDGERLICGYDDGAIRVWDAVTWSERVDRNSRARK